MNTIQRAIVAAGIVGVLAIVAIVIWAPRTDTLPAALGGPRAIDGPATPTTWPYSQVAILRDQRMSTDVLPRSFTASNRSIIAASARHLGTHGTEEIWLAVDGSQNLCLLFTEAGTGGSASACSIQDDKTSKPGAPLVSGGSAESSATVYADGAVKRTGDAAPEGQQIAYNTWYSAVKHPGELTGLHRSPANAGQYAYPLAYPYSSFAILRQDALPYSALPPFLKGSTSGTSWDDVDLSTVRYGGEYKGAKAWVALNIAGDVCLISRGAEDSTGVGCDEDHRTSKGTFLTGFGNGGVITKIATDGTPSPDDVGDDVKIGPNVWAGTTS